MLQCRTMRITTWLVLAGTLLWAGAASADDLVPLVPKMDPPAAAERLTQFHDALAQGLKAGGASVMPAATVRAKLKLGLENAGCDEGPCLQTNAALLGGIRMATARVSSVGKNYTIEVRLFRGNVQIAKTTGRCDVCTNVEAVQTLQRLATEVQGGAAAQARAEGGAQADPRSAAGPCTHPGPRLAPLAGPAQRRRRRGGHRGGRAAHRHRRKRHQLPRRRAR